MFTNPLHQPSPPPRSPTWHAIRWFRWFVVAFLAVFLVGFLYYGLAPWEHEYRVAGSDVVLREIATLGAPAGVTQVGSAGPDAGRLEYVGSYKRNGLTCAAISTYYAGSAAQAGWERPEGGTTYHKVSGGYYLEYWLDCREQPSGATTPPTYEVTMTIPFPHDVLLFKWIAGG